jgi:hypothetical protein
MSDPTFNSDRLPTFAAVIILALASWALLYALAWGVALVVGVVTA